jgi:hypothetical protein
MKSPVSRAITRHSRYPTSKRLYATFLPPPLALLSVSKFNHSLWLRLQVEQIMLAPNSSYSLSSLAALREVNSLTSPMTKTQAESVLASFVAKGWLLKSKYVTHEGGCK